MAYEGLFLFFPGNGFHLNFPNPGAGKKPVRFFLVSVHGRSGIPLADSFQSQPLLLLLGHRIRCAKDKGGLIPGGVLLRNRLHTSDKGKADFGVNSQTIQLLSFQCAVKVKAISLPRRRDGHLIRFPFWCHQTQACKGSSIRHLPGKFFGLLTIFSSQCKTTTLYYK